MTHDAAGPSAASLGSACDRGTLAEIVREWMTAGSLRVGLDKAKIAGTGDSRPVTAGDFTRFTRDGDD
jgi:hypothetical protein